MIEKPFDEIAKEDIDALITNTVGESRTLEYKQELPGSQNKDKKEFLADISSFANASGGDIIYGIKAKNGEPESVIPLANTTPDETKLRMEDLIRQSIAPRIRVQIKEIIGWGVDVLLQSELENRAIGVI